jgi:hypothetical protein
MIIFNAYLDFFLSYTRVTTHNHFLIDEYSLVAAS